MNWFIYTLGDASFFAAVLNGVAMIFGSGAFRGDAGSFGGSAILMVFLLALVAVIMAGLINQWKSGNNPTILLVLFIIWVAGGYTRVNVIVEDVYTGTSEAVSNVPILVALPASLITTAAVNFAGLFQTAFGAVDATAGSMTTDGFLNPLKMMLSVRQAASYSPHMTTNWGNFARNCIVGSTNPQAFITSPGGVIGALGNPDNLAPYKKTPYFQFNLAATGTDLMPDMLSCEVAGPRIAADFTAFFTPANPALNRAIRDGIGRDMTAIPKTWDDLSLFYASNSTLAGLDAQQTSANIMMYQTTMDVFKCGSMSSDPTAYFACTQLLSDQQQAFAVDAAAGGAGFTRTVISSMGFLLAIFFGLSPLVLLVALASGERALPLLGKYVMFGAWTQSWLPAAYLVNFFVLDTWTKAMNQLVGRFSAGLPIEAVPLFWMETSDKIAIASDLLAAVPLITLAAMTGSYFALAKLGERWSNRDYSNERMLAPQLGSVGAVSTNASMQEYSLGAGGQTSGAARVKYNLQDGLSQSVSDKEQEALRVGSEITRDFSQTGRFGGGWERAVQRAQTDASQVGQTWAQGVSFADKYSESDSFGDKLSEGTKSELAASLRGNVAAMLKGNGISGVMAGNYSGLSQEAQEWLTSTTEGREWANTIRNEFSQQKYSSLQNTDSLTTKAGFTEEEAAGIRESIATQAAAIQAYEEATQIASSVGASYSGHAGELTRSLAPMHQQIMGMHASLYADNSENGQAYRDAYDKIERHETNQGVSTANGQLGWIMGAMMGSGNYDQVMDIGRQITGASGLDTPDSGQFQGSSAPVANPLTLEQFRAENGAVPDGPPAPFVNPSYAAMAAGETPAPIDPVPDRSSNDTPVRPDGVRIFTDQDGERYMGGADANATAGVPAAVGYMFEQTGDYLSTGASAVSDLYFDHIGRPFSNAVSDFFGLGENTRAAETPSAPQQDSDRVRQIPNLK